jgi:hypothetical protein
MRSNLACGVSVVLSVLALGACKVSETTTGSGGAGGAGAGGSGGTSTGTGASTSSSSSSSSSSSGTGTGGWTAMALLDDDTDPQSVVSHDGQDRVTSIHFSALDRGIVATEGANGTISEGGMLYHASHHKLEGVALSGRHASGSGYEVAFQVIFPTKSGYAVGLDTSETMALSSDGGQTFSVVVPNIPYGLAHELVLFEGTDGKWTYAGGSGVISEAAQAPSPSTAWTELWAPEGLPPTPNPIPAGQCKVSPAAPNSPHSSQFVYVSPDRQFLAYPAAGEDPFTICISHDGGKGFFPKQLPPAPPGAGPIGPTGVTFITPQIGLAYDGYDLKTDGSFIYRTTDGGETWSLASLPAEVTEEYTSIRHVFFAPDATHGFAVGYTGKKPLLLRTTDAGATWEVAPGQASLATAMKSLDAFKLYAGFALDETHIWVGGEHGALLANDAGGD